jgi:hypothetical protein
MAVSLLVASATWAGFVMTRTVLDPGRSERLADRLLDDPEIRSVITERLADSIEAQIPTTVPVSRATVEQAASEALDDPRVEDLLRDGIVRVHQNALNGIDEPVTLDATALGEVGREIVVESNPELDAVLPPTPQLEVELPSTGLSRLGTIREQVERFTRIGALLSLAGMVTAFVLSRNRPKTLRRVSYWAFAASAFWLITAYALPWLLEQIAPSTVSIAMAAIDVFFGAMITPALVMAGVGVVLLALSAVWSSLARRRPAALVDRSARPRSAVAGAAGGATEPAGAPGWRPESRSAHSPMAPLPAARPGPAWAGPPIPTRRYDQSGRPQAATAGPPAMSRSDDPTDSFPVIVSRFDQELDQETASGGTGAGHPPGSDTGAAAAPDPDATLAAPRWQPGVGYLDEVGADGTGERRSNPSWDPGYRDLAGSGPGGETVKAPPAPDPSRDPGSSRPT